MQNVISIKTRQPIPYLPFPREYARDIMDYLFEYKKGERDMTNGEMELIMDVIDFIEQNSGACAYRLEDMEDVPPVEGA